ncbi:inositol monophosphatase family protein [Pseudonocardia sp. CA-142604]|uniref:inositol monophosphatase family protein n=1 Tax=Pseudonocardia sp. CA-142604 TaxID=3240024 RepID=UPI003D91B92B
MRHDPGTATPQDHRDATEIATAAGEMLLDLQVDLLDATCRQDELQLIADRSANDLILQQLAVRHPDDPVLSEEAEDPTTRLASRRVWIVDPLDGTREFAEGRDDWGVNVALVVDGVPVVGAVAVPSVGDTLSTSQPPRLPTRAQWPLIVVSRTRPPVFAAVVAEQLRAELRSLGSAAAKTAAVVTGEADIYIHAGGMHEWDAAAPVALAMACGLHASRMDGSPLRFNQPEPFLPDLLICHPELADEVLSVVREALG